MTPTTTLSVAAAAAITLWTLAYAGLCALRPYRPCPRCRGTGTRQAIIRVKDCTPCKRTGLRLRLGRRMWNRIMRTRAGR